MKRRLNFKGGICFLMILGFAACSFLLTSPAIAQTPQAEKAEVVGSDLGLSGKLGQAISEAQKGTGKGKIEPNAQGGYLGIPGAPKLNPIIGLLWAIWVGWIFSTVGAFGGIMAGVGHMTIYGLGNRNHGLVLVEIGFRERF